MGWRGSHQPSVCHIIRWLSTWQSLWFISRILHFHKPSLTRSLSLFLSLTLHWSVTWFCPIMLNFLFVWSNVVEKKSLILYENLKRGMSEDRLQLIGFRFSLKGRLRGRTGLLQQSRPDLFQKKPHPAAHCACFPISFWRSWIKVRWPEFLGSNTYCRFYGNVVIVHQVIITSLMPTGVSKTIYQIVK